MSSWKRIGYSSRFGVGTWQKMYPSKGIGTLESVPAGTYWRLDLFSPVGGTVPFLDGWCDTLHPLDGLAEGKEILDDLFRDINEE